ncbi:hypothetical protein GOP47_0006817 [Adiantum capillus-veneris]|uniref:Uncharacterized protein n=1 Tax=Adiantum capillus-veneris TaxID=13818 RepID=A0A9D4V4D1_ADICA|nr:hypothetical protein GOP47_0006817 [Adiantum capillus-veneris]
MLAPVLDADDALLGAEVSPLGTAHAGTLILPVDLGTVAYCTGLHMPLETLLHAPVMTANGLTKEPYCLHVVTSKCSALQPASASSGIANQILSCSCNNTDAAVRHKLVIKDWTPRSCTSLDLVAMPNCCSTCFKSGYR